jgi:hypothetical protein
MTDCSVNDNKNIATCQMVLIKFRISIAGYWLTLNPFIRKANDSNVREWLCCFAPTHPQTPGSWLCREPWMYRMTFSGYQPIAIMRSMGSLALEARSGSTVITCLSSRRASYRFSMLIIFIYSQTDSADTGT